MYFSYSLVTMTAMSTMVLGAIQNQTLRIMPLGASITNGVGSSTKNGYRLDLWHQLEAGKNTINYIGSQQSGSMIHKSNEGHPGWKIGQMVDASKETVKKRPNVILIFVGTNDMAKDAATAPAAMGSLVDSLVVSCPDAAILVAQITTSKDANMAKRLQKFDNDLVPVIKTRADAGKHVMLVDMSKLLDPKTDLTDNVHPNDAGFKKIANAWYTALGTAQDKGWIKAPTAVPGVVDGTTTKTSKTATHQENANADADAAHEKTVTTGTDGKVTTTVADTSSEGSDNHTADTATLNKITTGPEGNATLATTSASTTDSAADADSSHGSQVTVDANGKKTTSVNDVLNTSSENHDTDASTLKSTTQAKDGSTSSTDSSSSSSSDSSSSSSSSSSFEETSSKMRKAKRSAKFYAMMS